MTATLDRSAEHAATWYVSMHRGRRSYRSQPSSDVALDAWCTWEKAAERVARMIADAAARGSINLYADEIATYRLIVEREDRARQRYAARHARP